jgi:urea transport system permease protein
MGGHASEEGRHRLPRLWFFGIVIVLMLGLPGAASAAGDPFADIAATNFDVVAAGVRALAVAGNPRAVAVIDALREGRLYAWRWPRPDAPLYIRTAQGFIDARTGRKVAAPAPINLRRVIVNDTVRAAIATAEGALDLFSPHAAMRRRAAEALYRSGDPGALPLIEKALAQEHDPAVMQALREAAAAALLKSGTGSIAARRAAVQVLSARSDLSARNLFASLHGQPPPVRAAIAAAIRGIDRRLQLWGLVENFYYGISLGAVLLLAAAGLAITFGVMGVINMAHGEMVMIGAYTTFVVQQLIAGFAPALTAVGLVLAVPAAFLVAGALGIAIERLLIRFLYGRPLETLLATWGLSLILQQAVRSLFGPTNQDVTSPAWMSGSLTLGGLTLTVNRLWIILFAALVLLSLIAVLRWSGLGRNIRAVMQNRRMAAAMGIRTPWIDALTFGLGCGIAGMAGVALSQIDNVSPNLGQNYIIDSFIVVVVGGVGNLWGTLAGALTLGVIDKFIEPFAGAVLGKVLVLVLLILFIQRRPRGLFPVRGRAVEA